MSERLTNAQRIQYALDYLQSKPESLNRDFDNNDCAYLIEDMRDALTPSAKTKAAYMGEFSFNFPILEDGEEVVLTPNVPWTCIKEVMKKISEFGGEA